MLRRPVSESVAAQDLIMSDTTKDFYSCGRITHEITLRPSMFKRMQMLGVYKKVHGFLLCEEYIRARKTICAD